MPAIIALGMITSYQDIKFGKIRNKWVVLALVYAVLVYILLYLFRGGTITKYLVELGTNFLFSIAIGFGFWYIGLWTAGDGKLFIAYSALIPLSTYLVGYQQWIPSVTLLINIFVPALIIMVVFMLLKAKIKDIKKASISFLKEFFKPKELINSIISLFAIFWITQILLSLIGLGTNYLLKIILTITFMFVIQKKLKNKSLYFMLAISLLRIIIDQTLFSLSFLINMLILIFVWVFLISFLKGSLSRLGQEIFAKEIHVSKLKPGMILSEVIQKKEKITKKELNEFKKQPSIKIIKHQGDYYIKKPKSHFDLDNFIDEEAEGLTKEQINTIKEIGIKKIKVSQTIPFAPFIFLGVILTIIAKGNILIVIMDFI